MGMHGGRAGASSATSNDPTKTFSDKVDLNDLEWEDRERVLRLLFSKMNAGVQTNTLAARQQQKQATGREQTMMALSEEAVGNEYRDKYGNRAFDQYL